MRRLGDERTISEVVKQAVKGASCGGSSGGTSSQRVELLFLCLRCLVFFLIKAVRSADKSTILQRDPQQ